MFRSWCCIFFLPVQHYACQRHRLGNQGLLRLSRGRFVSWCAGKSLAAEARHQGTSFHPGPHCPPLTVHMSAWQLGWRAPLTRCENTMSILKVRVCWLGAAKPKKASLGLPGQLAWPNWGDPCITGMSLNLFLAPRKDFQVKNNSKTVSLRKLGLKWSFEPGKIAFSLFLKNLVDQVTSNHKYLQLCFVIKLTFSMMRLREA